MKHNFKKIISLLLTVVMLLGTMSALIPFSASAEENYVTITPNTDFTHNGITYRFDVRSGNTDSYARIYDDGSIEFKYSYGDILWFPDVKMTNTSALHAEVTAIAHDSDDSGMGNTFMGIVYGATEKADGSFNTGMAGILRTAGRARIVVISRENLTSKSGGDHGNGGGTKIYNDDTSFKAHANYASVKSINNDWGFNKTISFDVSRVDNSVTFAMSSADGEFFTKTYDNGSYAYAGAVGFTSIWANNAGYKTYRFDKLTLTNCTVNGEAKDTYTVFDSNVVAEPELPEGSVYLEKNKTATYKGITYRFDTNKANDSESWVRVNADGSWEINIRNGDMLWFPDVELTDASEVYLEITKTGTNTSDYFPGLAYGVTSSTDSTWTSTNVSVLRTYQNQKMRFRATAITRANAIKVSGSDYGNGGDARPFNNEFEATALWELIANPLNHNWNIGATVYHKVSQKDGNVVLEYGVPGYGAFVGSNNTSYANNYAGMYAIAGGSVGYTMVWQGNDTAHSQFRIEDITITNCLVGGVEKGSYSVKALDQDVSNAQLSLSLDGTIGLNFGFNSTNLPDNATVVVTKNGEEILNQAVVDGENIVTAPVNAKEMNDTVNFSIKVDGELFDNQSYTTSVKEYADAMLASEDYAEWHELIGAMLNYGAAAQKVLNYKTDALVADIDGLYYDVSEIGDIIVTNNTDKLAGLFATLTLESDTALNLYFKTKNGEALTFTVNGNPATATPTEDGFIRLTVADIAADQLADEFVIIVNGGEIEITISAVEWAKTVVNSNESAEMKTLAMALAAYADAAKKK